jgi:peptidoglycan/xylan/chitin deacetylase (PgdA/CDA1 family)
MASSGIVFLMYHELELPGRSLIQSEPGYVRYILRESTFQAQIDWLRHNGWNGLSVGDALRAQTRGKSVAITFDDGCETDLLCAARVLREAGFNATFYVTAGFLNRPGYMSTAQLRELHSSAFEIGCHSMTHAYLNDLSPQQLQVEVVDARSKLENAIGSAVAHFSCPGGRYNDRVTATVRRAGFLSLAASRAYANLASADPFRLGRVAIMRDTGPSEFERICTGESLWRKRIAESLRMSARKLLGNAFYDRVRTSLLRQP